VKSSIACGVLNDFFKYYLLSGKLAVIRGISDVIKRGKDIREPSLPVFLRDRRTEASGL
jgi:hypothetical protein